MPKPVYVALWHLDTRAAPGADEPTYGDKVLSLQRKVTAAANHFAQLDNGEDDPIHVFAAPEYYFAEGGDLIRGYSSEAKEAIKRALRDISGQFPRMILCAGTVAWKEELDRSQRKKVAAHLKTIQDTHSNSGGSYRREVDLARNNIKLGKSFTKSKSSKRWFGHNTAFIYNGGILVGELNKAGNAGEFNGEDDPVVMIPGYRSGKFNMPMVEGTEAGRKLSLGVEICADAGRLGNTFKEEVDIHLLISASQIPQGPAARPGGLYLHCDSNRPPRVDRVVQMQGEVEPYADRRRLDVGPHHVDDNDLYVCRVELEDRA